MKLSRLYSNKPEVFDPVDFLPGLNVVMAEIRSPENRDRDTHNLGKTSLGHLLDFCLLSGRDNKMFLFKNAPLFDSFIFFLEIELRPGSFVTVRREVVEPSRISFKRDMTPGGDYSDLSEDKWDHWKVPFDRSRTILDGLLDLSAVKPWGYRKGLGYLLRTQKDYSDVFQLARFASAHADWKPYLAHILGFDADILAKYYKQEESIEILRAKERTIQAELGGSIEDLSKVEGLLLLKQKDAEKQQALLDAFDFRSEDKETAKHLVNDLDERIAALNADRYSLLYNRNRVSTSLTEGNVLFDPDEAAVLFEEVGVLFDGQLKRDFDQLVAFNRSISEERKQYLDEELQEIDGRLKAVSSELNRLGKQRTESLAYLGDTDVFRKYKSASESLIALRADVLALTSQRAHLHTLQGLRAEVRIAVEELGQMQSEVERNIEETNDSENENLFSSIRILFDEIIRSAIDRSALLTVNLNQEHHPEFSAEILDDTGRATSADRGNSYKKLLCVAFDLAILRAHLGMGYPQFVYHDGVFETLDPRKKANLLAVIRAYADEGIQQIITLIDSDTPPSESGEPAFAPEEIVLTLHDQGISGRLFKIEAW